MQTIPQQIAANKRTSLLFAFGLIVILAALGTVIAGIWRPHFWCYGTGGALLVGLVVSLVGFNSGSDIVLSISRAREATHAEDQVLDNVVEEMAIAAGIPKPKIYVIDDPAPNAFATGKDPQHAIVTVTTGLMAKLDRDELQGVIAHEMSHVRNYDIRFMTVVAILAGLIPLLADMFRMSLWFGGGSRDREDRDSGLGSFFAIIGIVLAIVAPIFAVLLQLAVSRQREYLADASAAELTRYPEGLANALRKIATDPDPLQVANRATQHMYIVNPLQLASEGSDLLSTHPSTDERIRRLLGLMGRFHATSIEAPGARPGL